MKERIDQVTAAVDSLMAITERFERGQVIPWADIEAVAGSREENRARHIIGKWRRRLLRERDIVTRPAVAVGVHLLTHREAAEKVPEDRQKRAYRQVRRGLKETDAVDGTALSDHERKVLSCQRTNMASQRRELFRSRRDLAKSLERTQTLPRRKIPAQAH